MKNILLYKVFGSTYARDIAIGIGQYAREQGDWHLLFVDKDIRMLNQIARLEISGSLIFDYNVEHLVQNLHPGPMVSVYGHCTQSGVSIVTIDNEAAGAMAAQAFYSRGFRNYGYLGLKGNVASKQRHNGFVKWLQKRNLPVDTLEIPEIPSPNKVRKTLAPLKRWCKNLLKPTAVLAFNDFMGWYLIETCNDLGIQVPNEMAVIGVDNDQTLCSMSRPQLSSLIIPSFAIGYKAAAILHQRMKNLTDSGAPITFPPERIALRQSSDVFAVTDLAAGEVLSFIQAHPEKAVSVDFLAKKFGMSRRSLQRHITEGGHLSVSKAVNYARMQKAQNLLVETNFPVNEIGSACGFEYAHHFSRKFKLETGLTPIEYRKQFNPSLK